MNNKIRKTDEVYFYDECQFCGGSGRVAIYTKKEGWYIDYNFQDGHSLGGPYNEKKAKRIYKKEDKGCIKTLIGPDGYIYS